MNGEDIVGHPSHIRLVPLDQPLQFVSDGRRFSATMRLAKHFVTAPAAVVRAAPCRNQRNRTHAMMFAPCSNILAHVNGFAIGPRLGVDIAQLLARFCLNDSPVGAAKSNAIHSMKGFLRTSW